MIRDIADPRFRRYQVNVLVDNGNQQGAPVVYEDNPTHQTLVGRVEHLARFGALVTDFNLLVAGALHRANGGYLVLDAQKLLTGNYGWPSLKRALDSGQIRIETLDQLLSAASTVSLQPEPIPLSVKIVLVGTPAVYYLLSASDDDFPELFKIAADFDDRVDRTAETTLLYARMICAMTRREKLRGRAGLVRARLHRLFRARSGCRRRLDSPGRRAISHRTPLVGRGRHRARALPARAAPGAGEPWRCRNTAARPRRRIGSPRRCCGADRAGAGWERRQWHDCHRTARSRPRGGFRGRAR